jgi:3'-5' exoribonuclease
MTNLEAKDTNFESHIWVKDLAENGQVAGLYLVKVKRQGVTKKGDPYLSITLGDRTGEVEARVWERAAELASLFNEGDIVEIKGLASSYRNQIQLTLSDLKATQTKIDPSLFLESTTGNVDQMLGALKGLLNTLENPHLKSLVQRFWADKQFMALFSKAPAAKNFHHSYLGGLLEHTLAVCQLAVNIVRFYPELDKDLLLAGAFLHDIGKVQELKCEPQIDYSDQGRLLGHLVLGVGMLEEKLNGLDRFPDDLALRLKHLILSHHGQFEFGSPKRPKFLEAFALNLIDDLDAKIKGLGSFLEKDKQEGAWTEFNKLFERFLLKGKIEESEDKGGQNIPPEDPQKKLF